MSFRRRLILFFVLIVVLPMVAVAVLVTQVADEWRNGKADAGLAASMDTALSTYRTELDVAADAARVAGRDEELARALRAGDEQEAEQEAERLAGRLDVAGLTVEDAAGRTLASTGGNQVLAEAEVVVRTPSRTLGQVRAYATRASDYADEVGRLTGREIAVFRGDRRLASTVELGDAPPPAGEGTGDVDLPGGEFRVSTVAPDEADPTLRLAMFEPRGSAGLLERQPLVLVAVVAFFAVALLFVVLVIRALQGQLREMFTAARRIGGGDFSAKVPVEGDDEIAGLAREFNTMSERLSEQMAELHGQRVELERSVRRIGEAFAAGLDRTALLEIAAETALAACEATTARVVVTGPGGLEKEVGEGRSGELGEAIREAEEHALREGTSEEVARGAARAVAEPLGRGRGPRSRGAVMSIGRVGPPFERGQREMLRYLAGQAAISVENVELHELITEGAITDELTGLANRRRFEELLEDEAQRAERFGNELSVLLLRIDDLDRVGVAHGRLQADLALREMARVLQTESRGVDHPARYEGSEFAVALPETGTEGALELSDRVRTRIEHARIPLTDGEGTLRLEASMGIATMTGGQGSPRDLVAAARAALDRATAAGGGRAEVADLPARPDVESRMQ